MGPWPGVLFSQKALISLRSLLNLLGEACPLYLKRFLFVTLCIWFTCFILVSSTRNILHEVYFMRAGTFVLLFSTAVFQYLEQCLRHNRSSINICDGTREKCHQCKLFPFQHESLQRRICASNHEHICMIFKRIEAKIKTCPSFSEHDEQFLPYPS